MARVVTPPPAGQVTRAGAAALGGCDTQTVDRWIRDGKVHATKTARGQVLVDQVSLVHFLAIRTAIRPNGF